MSHHSDDEDGFVHRDGRVERVLFTVILLILFNVSQTLLWILTLGQVVWTLFYGTPNDHIAEFGARLGVWLKRAVLYVSGTTDEKPFPWREID